MYVNVSTRVPGLCLSLRPLRLSNENKAGRPRAVYNAPVQRVVREEYATALSKCSWKARD